MLTAAVRTNHRHARMFALVVLLTAPWAVQAQAPTSAPASAAPGYEARFTEVMALDAGADGVADVSNLVIQRDVARFTFASGKLYRLKPLGGRTVGVLFRGTGTFAFTPQSTIEQARLARYNEQRAIEAPFTDVVLLFADTTMAELGAGRTFHEEQAPGEFGERVRDALKFLSDEDSRTFDPDLMGALLNGDTTDLFYAHIRRRGGDPLLFMLNPHEVEAVSLGTKSSARGYGRDREVLAQFPRASRPRDALLTGERIDAAEIRRYVMNIDLPASGVGEIGFAATARLDITASSPVGPWVAFVLFDKMKVDSARWDGGGPATVFKGKDAGLLWVNLGSRMQPGETRTLVLSYHGDLIDRDIDFFRIKSSVAWYPLSLEYRTLAVFDLTFTTSDAYQLASVGERVDSSRNGRLVTSRWLTPGPIRNASFNLGLFKDYTVREAGIPAVTVMISTEAHKKLVREYGLAQQGKMRETVAGDVSRSLQFFQSVFGPTQVRHFYATEIPDDHGEAFPGMVHLSWVTFARTDDQGLDEIFRAHEVAHQWWGIGVDYMTYHDRWLSEGFATFSGLWYMQTVRKSNDKYFGQLRDYRTSIFLRGSIPGPVSLGHRVRSSKDRDVDDYSTIVYKKGAWAVHMLRMLMLDLKTMNEDRFTETMQDFYQSYQGKRASTADFRRVVERHTGVDMGWFFDQWIYGTALPTYKVAYRTEPREGGQFQVRLQVQQEGVPEGFLMYVPVTLDLGKDRLARVRVKVTGAVSEIDLPLMPAEPKSVKFNDLEAVLADVKMVGWRR